MDIGSVMQTSSQSSSRVTPGDPGLVTWRPTTGFTRTTHTPTNVMMDQKSNIDSARALIKSTPNMSSKLFDSPSSFFNRDNVFKPPVNITSNVNLPSLAQQESSQLEIGADGNIKGNLFSSHLDVNPLHAHHMDSSDISVKSLPGNINFLAKPPTPKPYNNNATLPSVKSDQPAKLTMNQSEHIEWNLPGCTAPPLDINNISESLNYFQRFTDVMKMPSVHRKRLLLLELQRVQPNAFKEFLQLGKDSYEELQLFILRRFDSISSIHKIHLNPNHITNDAMSQFSLMADLYKKTPPEEFVKFLVMKTSPPALQDQLEESVHLPYDSFFQKYKKALFKYNRHVDSYNDKTGTPRSANYIPRQTTSQGLYNTPVCEMHKKYGQTARSCHLPGCGMKTFVAQARKDHENFIRNSKNVNGQVN